MSRFFGGVLVRETETTVRAAFDSLRFEFSVRMCRFSQRVFGVYTVRASATTWDDLERIASAFSVEVGSAVRYYYHSISGEFVRLFVRGQVVREFSDEADSLWVPLDQDGELMLDGPRYRYAERPEELVCGYLRSPIDAALEAIGESSLTLDRESLDAAFGMGGRDWIAESTPVV